ncbi:hypothetical protein BDY17DRAFT_305324 [Neohortaea acidophila]|uniref:DUF7514 domain-containing protein n=1 Tax=Neohortaea acidophila TaxID=245834 RepID=A0A6A6PHU2_9PEZI|nr:uncharacterized protein BDY17DRAFT_305324 [Neohortaea acidophila]KAF2479301.1 hypothetical protein BDY17DRAFT_305324 [Neohortaea acidophila]
MTANNASPSSRFSRDRADDLPKPTMTASQCDEGQPTAHGRTASIIQDVSHDHVSNPPTNTKIDPAMFELLTARVVEEATRRMAAQRTPPFSASGASSPHSSQSQATPLTLEQGDSVFGINATSPPRPPSDVDSHFSQHSGTSGRRSDDIWSMEDAELPATRSGSERTTRPAAGLSRSNLPQEDDARVEEDIRSSSRPGRKDSKLGADAASDGLSRGVHKTEAPGPEETALERAWGPLFCDGEPTPRLSSFLRGLALHLIDDYEPKRSLVVTPAKMQRFYSETRIDAEIYPWDTIFGRLPAKSLSRMYSRLACPYHLVQEGDQDHPTIPSLTPRGFEIFMTCLIQAQPDAEFDRLAKAVMHMPISSADNMAERFPKELSRRLFPATPQLASQQRLVASLDHEPDILDQLKGLVSMPPPPPPMPQRDASLYPERQRQPYSRTPRQTGALSDDDFDLPYVPLERQRLPYTGREGSGRVFGEDPPLPAQPYGAEASNRRSTGTGARVPTNSMHGTSSGSSEPINIPPRTQPRPPAGSPPSVHGRQPRLSRHRSSPPPRSAFGRSDSSIPAMPEQQFGSRLHPAQSSPEQNSTGMGSFEKGGSRGFRGESFSTRNAPAFSAYNYHPGSMGGPVGDPLPSSSYEARRAWQPPPPETARMRDRRRNTINSQASGQGGGPDWHGSSSPAGSFFPPSMTSSGSAPQH